MKSKIYKIVVFVPEEDADKVREAMGKAGAGGMGQTAKGELKYDFCSSSTKLIGRFRPLAGSKPHIGTHGKIEKVSEERIEVVCEEKLLSKVIKAIVKTHPYEEPAIDIWPIIDWHRYQ